MQKRGKALLRLSSLVYETLVYAALSSVNTSVRGLKLYRRQTLKDSVIYQGTLKVLVVTSRESQNLPLIEDRSLIEGRRLRTRSSIRGLLRLSS
jgi:hypothetical protein